MVCYRRPVVAIVIASLLFCATTASAQDAETVYKKVLPSVMTLKVAKKDGSVVLGTGFLALKDGCAVTAWHVVRDARSAVARFSDGQEFEVSGLVDRDEKRDVALVRVKVADRPLLAFASGDPAVGSKAFVIGAPEGLEFSISDGIISQLRDVDGVKQYQYTCPTSHGNSGGPVTDGEAHVLGVVSWGLKDGQNLNFAIAGSYAKGLDASLPTTVWDTVKPSATPSFSPEADDVSTAVAVLRMRIEATGYYEAAWDLDRESSRVGPDHLVIPQSVYQATSGLRLLAARLRRLRFTDAELNAAVAGAAEMYDGGASGLEDMRSACDYAIRSSWDNYALTLFNKGFAKLSSNGLPWEPVLKKLRALIPDKEISKWDPDVIKALFDEEDSWPFATKCGFILDIRALPSVMVSAARRKGAAAKADFRPADLVLDVAGQPIKGWTEFEQLLAKNAGKKVTIRVRRMKGGEAKLNLEVPK